MRAAGRVVRQVLDRMRQMCQPGVTTRQMDEEAFALFTSLGARGLFRNYPTYRPGEGFPSHLCLSVNEVVVHGIADDRPIESGDIVGVDCGVQLDGWCGDSATTLLVGEVSDSTRRMCEATEQCLALAIELIHPGKRWSQVAREMQRFAESAGFGVVRDFVGHGIGQTMHQDPKVPNFVSREFLREDFLLEPGMVLAVEPMLTQGGADVQTLADGWTVITCDRLPAAHYEHTVAVTRQGADVLTDGR